MFGSQRINVCLANNKCTHNVSFFVVVFGQETSLYHTLMKWGWSSSNCYWCWISHINTVLSAVIWCYWCGQYVVSMCQTPYSQWNNSISAWGIFWSFTRFGDQNWPPRSRDLTPLDFFLCSYLKSKVYVNKSTITRALQEEIKLCINEIQPQLCRKVMQGKISTKECV